MTRAALVAATLLAPALALAHPVGLSRGELTVADDRVTALVQVSARELGLDPPAADPVPAALAAAAQAATLGAVRVSLDGRACPFTPGAVRAEPPDGLAVEGSWTCPGRSGRLEVVAGFVETLPRGHTHLAHVSAGALDERHVLRAGRSSFVVSRGEPAAARALAFARLGVAHILGGLDHLAFLLAVLLVAPTLRRVVQLVTSFTVAHSLALALAATGALTVSPRIVEPLIAASVVAVALENLWLVRGGATEEQRARGVARRWRLTFLFGLVHGLGFAGALEELALGEGDLALALVSFNVGVELGQLAVAAAAVPLLLALARRSGVARRATRAGSLAVGAVGAAWLVMRVAAP